MRSGPVVDGGLAGRAEGEEVARAAPSSRGGLVAPGHEGVEGGGQSRPYRVEVGGGPVDALELGRPVRPQPAVGRAQTVRFGLPRVDGRQPVQLELDAGARVALAWAVAGLEVDELQAAVAFVDGVDAPPHQVLAGGDDERGLDSDGLEVGVGALKERPLEGGPLAAADR